MKGLYTEKIINKEKIEEINDIVELIKGVKLQSISVEQFHEKVKSMIERMMCIKYRLKIKAIS